MKQFKPLSKPDRPKSSYYSIFLGGSIEQGKAENWQDWLVSQLEHWSDDLAIMNPRRDHWDASWPQDPTPGTEFHSQVCWELDRQDDVDLIVYWFDPATVSPITLLELGAYGATKPQGRVVVMCPKDYFRYGNVAIFCAEYGIPLFETKEELLAHISEELKTAFNYEEQYD